MWFLCNTHSAVTVYERPSVVQTNVPGELLSEKEKYKMGVGHYLCNQLMRGLKALVFRQQLSFP